MPRLLSVLTSLTVWMPNLRLLACSVYSDSSPRRRICATLEELVIGTAIAALSNLDSPLYKVSPNSVCSVTMVTAMTLERVEAAAGASPSYQKLNNLIVSGVYEDKTLWPADLLPYYAHRHALITAGPVLLYHDHPVSPVSLRQEVLDILHGGN